MKRILVLLILTTMVIHAASRMGVLSYLYQERHNIAYTIGLIDEIPIAICGHEYEFDKEFRIHGYHSNNLPATLPIAQKINLYISIDCSINLPLIDFFLKETVLTDPYQGLVSNGVTSEIFQPPRVLS